MEFYEETDWLSLSQKTALKAFNRCCMEVRGEYPRGRKGLLSIRRAAIDIYIRRGNSLHTLIDALMFFRPKWDTKEYSRQALDDYMSRLCWEKEWLRDRSEMFVTISTNRFIREIRRRCEHG